VPDDTVQSGLNDNSAGALAYITIIPAIIFLVAAPYNQNPNIRFHAWQSIFLCIALFALSIIAIVPILGWIVYAVGAIALFIGWIMCILKALKGERFKLPIIGDLAAKQAGV
jgi:uncharacterized membrane protein